jgi:aldose 1-epimerase
LSGPRVTGSSIEYEPFGSLNGKSVYRCTLRNGRGMVARFTNFGATLTELHVVDRKGAYADVVLGFDSFKEYAATRQYFGATVGRNANRIDRGRFVLGEREYQLACNDPPHHLHGGRRGWDRVIWDVVRDDDAAGSAITFRHSSPDGEEGYPGAVRADVRFVLGAKDELVVRMTAQCSARTLLNLAHHSYWNLAGHPAGSVLDHELQLHADEYTPGSPIVPDGAVRPVVGTPFDFTCMKRLGRDIDRLGPESAGYDHNFVVRGDPGTLRQVARLRDPVSGRMLTLCANQPGMQLYSGNFLDGSIVGKGGAVYGHRSGVCLETQCCPNAINVPAWRSQVVLEPGMRYEHVMVYRFSVC